MGTPLLLAALDYLELLAEVKTGEAGAGDRSLAWAARG
jgi:hypothetical protein